jgi:hypothetical protein
MSRSHALSTTALAVILGIMAAGCAPKAESTSPTLEPSQTSAAKQDSTPGTKIVTATLKAAGMT